MELENKLKKTQAILLQIPVKSYSNQIVKVVKSLGSKRICYVTLNKTAASLMELFKKKKVSIKNLIFIDAISKTVRDVKKSENNCYYVSSPGSLTELSLVITKFLKHNFDYIIFDSVTNIVTYQNEKVAQKFVYSIYSKIKSTNTKGIFFGLDLKGQEDLILKLSSILDGIVKVR